uniref:Bidirectional sugar transporter SWEET n=1 Tax=Globisporangium ultimum (strain ATCC 200006 / CBS 805.95 / DAOM BR144) TaxID=431595 RepID=K3X1W0_GLOUD
MILSPTPTIYRIWKNKDVGIASVVPLVAVLGNSHVWMLYGYMGGNIFPIFTNFMTGDFAGSIFIAVYYRYTKDRRRVHQVVGFELLALSLVTIYFFLALHGVTHQSRDQSALTVGSIGVFFSMKLYGAGLERIALVLRHKNGAYIPVHMVIMGSINNFLWVVYTGLDSNWLMFGTCLTSCTLSVIQVILYIIFNPNRPKAGTSQMRLHEDADVHALTAVVVDTRPEMAQKTIDDKQCALPESPVFYAMRSPLSSLQSKP